LISAGVKDHRIEMIDAQSGADIAYAIGKWSANAPGEDGETQRYEGTVVTVFRRQAMDPGRLVSTPGIEPAKRLIRSPDLI
jgi:ketosteroid isomerase-like protein